MLYKSKTSCLLYLFLLACFSQFNLAQEKPGTDTTSVQKGIVKSKATYLAKPVYPPTARALRIGAQVNVRITIDKNGDVISAKAETGDSLFHKYAEEAALKSKFTPTTMDGVPIKVNASLTFNFTRPPDWESIGVTLANIEMGIASIGNYQIKDLIGEGLQEEAKEYDLLTRSESMDGKPIRATKLIDSIQSKLERLHPIDAWYFRLGLIKSRLSNFATKTDGEAAFHSHLKKLTDLYNSTPSEIPTERLEALNKAIQISLKPSLTMEDRKIIVNLLIESYNQIKGRQP